MGNKTPFGVIFLQTVFFLSEACADTLQLDQIGDTEIHLDLGSREIRVFGALKDDETHEFGSFSVSA